MAVRWLSPMMGRAPLLRPAKRPRPIVAEEQVEGKQEPTQFVRLLQDLEITSIMVRSPQAKGRAETHGATKSERIPSSSPATEKLYALTSEGRNALDVRRPQWQVGIR